MTNVYKDIVATTLFNFDIHNLGKKTHCSVLVGGVLIPQEAVVGFNQKQTAEKKVEIATPVKSLKTSKLGVKLGNSSLGIAPFLEDESGTYIKVDRLIYLMKEKGTADVLILGSTLYLRTKDSARKAQIEKVDGEDMVKLTVANLEALGLDIKGNKVVFS